MCSMQLILSVALFAVVCLLGPYHRIYDILSVVKINRALTIDGNAALLIAPHFQPPLKELSLTQILISTFVFFFFPSPNDGRVGGGVFVVIAKVFPFSLMRV